MLHKSVWQATAETVAFPAIESNIAVDTAIIGGGITGMTAAMLLAKAGQQVAVVEAFDIGGGTTGNSTGNLYAMVGRHLSRLRDKWGEAAMQAVAQSGQRFWIRWPAPGISQPTAGAITDMGVIGAVSISGSEGLAFAVVEFAIQMITISR